MQHTVTMLGSAGLMSFLVLGQEWDSLTAILLIREVAVALCVLGLSILFFVTKREDRPALVRSVSAAIQADVHGMLVVLGLRR